MLDFDEEKQARDNKIIAEQNDRFRNTYGADFSIPGKVVWTQGIEGLKISAKTDAMQKVQKFDKFDEDNDPYGDHSFGAFKVLADGEETTVFWKIDLYDAAYEYGSPEPTKPFHTRRVLTIMLGSEY